MPDDHELTTIMEAQLGLCTRAQALTVGFGRKAIQRRHRRGSLEIDSELYHGSDLERRLDAERTQRLEAAGWLVRRVRELDVWHNPIAVVEIVREGRRAARLRQA